MRPLLVLPLCAAALVGGGCGRPPTASSSRLDAARPQAEPAGDAAARPVVPVKALPDASAADGGGPDLHAIVGRDRAVVERRLGPPEGTVGIWVRYAGGLSVAYNRGVAVRARVRVARGRSCTEAGLRLGFHRAEPSRPCEAGTCCVLERPPDRHYRGSIVGRIEDGVFTVRPVSRSRCGNEVLR